MAIKKIAISTVWCSVHTVLLGFLSGLLSGIAGLGKLGKSTFTASGFSSKPVALAGASLT